MGDRQRKPLKPDTVVRNYWSGNEEFADLFNAVLFQGKPVIHPAELTSTDTDSSTVREHGGSQGTLQSVEGTRDNIKIHKRAASHGVELVLLGLENQERIHYAMPIRVMGYDHSVYQKQYNENAKKFRASLKSKGERISEDEFLSGMRRSDRFVPVVTVVIYYGEKSWDGAKSLHEILNIPDPMRPYINDYRMILVEARENTLTFHNKNNEDFFHLLKIILDTEMSEKDAREQAIRYCEEHKTDRDVIIAAAGATNTKLDYNALTKKEGNTMCTLFEKIAKEGEARGEKRTTITNIQSLMETMHLTADQAMEALRISPAEQQEYRESL